MNERSAGYNDYVAAAQHSLLESQQALSGALNCNEASIEGEALLITSIEVLLSIRESLFTQLNPHDQEMVAQVEGLILDALPTGISPDGVDIQTPDPVTVINAEGG